MNARDRLGFDDLPLFLQHCRRCSGDIGSPLDFRAKRDPGGGTDDRTYPPCSLQYPELCYELLVCGSDFTRFWLRLLSRYPDGQVAQEEEAGKEKTSRAEG